MSARDAAADTSGAPAPAPACLLRVASYNVRADLQEDVGTVHEWSVRRHAVASAILSLGADLIALQEPSPVQAAHLQSDLGNDWNVVVDACDPDAWAASRNGGPPDEARAGNGVAYRKSRFRLESRCAPAAPALFSSPLSYPRLLPRAQPHVLAQPDGRLPRARARVGRLALPAHLPRLTPQGHPLGRARRPLLDAL